MYQLNHHSENSNNRLVRWFKLLSMFGFYKHVNGENRQLEINMMKKLNILLGLALLIVTGPIYANDEFPPSWRGAPGSLKVVFNFDDPNTFNEGVVTGLSAGSVVANALEGQEFGFEACSGVSPRLGVVAEELSRALISNPTPEGEGVIIRVQITSTLAALPFTGIEVANETFDSPDFVFCDGAEGLEEEPVGESGDLGDGFYTIAIEALFADGFGCDDIQVFFEEIEAGTCIDEIIIDIQHSTNPGEKVVASALPAEINVVEGGATVDMVISLDPNIGSVDGSVTVTLDPNSGFDVEFNASTTPPVLTFTNLNWTTPQTVAIGGSDDTNFEVCIETFSFQAQVASVSDSEFNNGVAQVPLTINVTDLDTGCVFVAGEPQLEEITGGMTDTLVYSLNRAPSSGTVLVDISDGFEDPNMPFFTADPNVLTFDGTNWAIPQTTTLTAVQDDDYRGEAPGTGDPTTTTAVTALSAIDTFFTGGPDPVTVSIAEDECGALEFDAFDFDEDCVVDVNDLATFLGDWLGSTIPTP